jgi:HSP20 family molecular chaperone IbpA
MSRSFMDDIFGRGGVLEEVFGPFKAEAERVQREAAGYSMYRHNGVMELDLDLPGRVPNDVSIEAEGDALVILASATDGRRPRPEKRLVFQLDPEHDVDNITASLENGVLTVRIPARPAEKARKVKVSIG